MFLCECHHCGRRELRGPRSLATAPDGAFVTTCRACGTPVLVAGAQPTPARQAVSVPARHAPHRHAA